MMNNVKVSCAFNGEHTEANVQKSIDYENIAYFTPASQMDGFENITSKNSDNENLYWGWKSMGGYGTIPGLPVTYSNNYIIYPSITINSIKTIGLNYLKLYFKQSRWWESTYTLDELYLMPYGEGCLRLTLYYSDKEGNVKTYTTENNEYYTCNIEEGYEIGLINVLTNKLIEYVKDTQDDIVIDNRAKIKITIMKTFPKYYTYEGTQLMYIKANVCCFFPNSTQYVDYKNDSISSFSITRTMNSDNTLPAFSTWACDGDVNIADRTLYIQRRLLSNELKSSMPCKITNDREMLGNFSIKDLSYDYMGKKFSYSLNDIIDIFDKVSVQGELVFSTDNTNARNYYTGFNIYYALQELTNKVLKIPFEILSTTAVLKLSGLSYCNAIVAGKTLKEVWETFLVSAQCSLILNANNRLELIPYFDHYSFDELVFKKNQYGQDLELNLVNNNNIETVSYNQLAPTNLEFVEKTIKLPLCKVVEGTSGAKYDYDTIIDEFMDLIYDTSGNKRDVTMSVVLEDGTRATLMDYVDNRTTTTTNQDFSIILRVPFVFDETVDIECLSKSIIEYNQVNSSIYMYGEPTNEDINKTLESNDIKIFTRQMIKDINGGQNLSWGNVAISSTTTNSKETIVGNDDTIVGSSNTRFLYFSIRVVKDEVMRREDDKRHATMSVEFKVKIPKLTNVSGFVVEDFQNGILIDYYKTAYEIPQNSLIKASNATSTKAYTLAENILDNCKDGNKTVRLTTTNLKLFNPAGNLVYTGKGNSMIKVGDIFRIEDIPDILFKATKVTLEYAGDIKLTVEGVELYDTYTRERSINDEQYKIYD